MPTTNKKYMKYYYTCSTSTSSKSMMSPTMGKSTCNLKGFISLWIVNQKGYRCSPYRLPSVIVPGPCVLWPPPPLLCIWLWLCLGFAFGLSGFHSKSWICPCTAVPALGCSTHCTVLPIILYICTLKFKIRYLPWSTISCQCWYYLIDFFFYAAMPSEFPRTYPVGHIDLERN